MPKVDEKTAAALTRMDKEGGVVVEDERLAWRIVNKKLADERGGLLWITDIGFECLERHEQFLAGNKPNGRSTRWEHIRDRLYKCRVCGLEKSMTRSTARSTRCAAGCMKDREPDVGLEINGFITTDRVIIATRYRAADRYGCRCLVCGVETQKTRYELYVRKSGCSPCLKNLGLGGGVVRNRTGERHGDLTVVSRGKISSHGTYRWNMVCDNGHKSSAVVRSNWSGRCRVCASSIGHLKVGDVLNGRKITRIVNTKTIHSVCVAGHETATSYIAMKNYGCGQCRKERTG